MTINDLRIDIITAVSQLTDVELLKDIKENIGVRAARDASADPWWGAKSTLRSVVSFEELMMEQQYQPVSYEVFTEEAHASDWAVSLDTLLAVANESA